MSKDAERASGEASRSPPLTVGGGLRPDPGEARWGRKPDPTSLLAPFRRELVTEIKRQLCNTLP